MTTTTQLSEKTWYLRQVDIFRGLSFEEVEEMGPMMEPRTFRAGDLLVGPTTPPQRIYVVKSGRVRLFHRGPDGREITAGTVGRGALLGVSTLFDPAPDGFLYAEATSDVLVCIGDGWAFLRSIARWPRVMLNLAVQLGAQLVQTEQQLDRFTTGDSRARVAGALYRLALEAAEDVPGGRMINSAVTHAALARQIGASRETVTRALTTLEGEGYIRRERRHIIVTEPARLRAAFNLPEDG